MTYIPALNQVQLGQEATFKTPQTPTILPTGLSKVIVTPKVEVEQIKTLAQGTTMPAKYSYVKKRWSEFIIEGLLDYNRAMVWFDSLFTADASSPHTYKADEDAAMTPKGITMVFGQSGLTYRTAGMVINNLKLSCASGGPWKYSAKGFGLAVTNGASLESLTEDVPELVHGYETTLYMDEDLDATIGTTERADVSFTFEANISNGQEPVWHQGDQVWDSIRQGQWGGSYKLVMEADATNLDSLGDILDAVDVGKGFTIRNQATDGTNTLKLDFCGVVISPPQLPSEKDGVVTVELDMVPQWNSVYDSCWGAELTIA